MRISFKKNLLDFFAMPRKTRTFAHAIPPKNTVR